MEMVMNGKNQEFDKYRHEAFPRHAFGIYREHTVLAGRITHWTLEKDKEVEHLVFENEKAVDLGIRNALQTLNNKNSSIYQRHHAKTIFEELRTFYKNTIVTYKTESPAIFLCCADLDRDFPFDLKPLNPVRRYAFNTAREALGLTSTKEDYEGWLGDIQKNERRL